MPFRSARYFGLALGLGAIACSPSPTVKPPPPAFPPYFALVIVEGALINATKTDGRCWDVGCDQKRAADAAKAAASLAKAAIVTLTGAAATTVAPFAAAFAVLAPLAARAMSLPDAAGNAFIISGGEMSRPQSLAVQRDTLTPQWGVSFQHVLISPTTALRVSLVDVDADILSNRDDDMGIVNVGADDLVRATQAGGTYQVPTATQTNDQVLFVGISVHPER